MLSMLKIARSPEQFQQEHVKTGVCTYPIYISDAKHLFFQRLVSKLVLTLSPPLAPVLYTAIVQT
jgi:hypothetical protein